HVRATLERERRGNKQPLNPVEQAPVPPERGLRRRDEPILVVVSGKLGEQLASLGGVLGVAALVEAEVRRALTVPEAVALDEALPLDPRDLGLAALDGIEGYQAARQPPIRGPGAHALVGLGRGRVGDVSPSGPDEAVPQLDVLALLV